MPNFTQKHYVKVADVLRTIKLETDDGSSQLHTINLVESKLANLFASDNANFKRDTFHRACQP